MWARRAYSWLFGAFALVALVLSAAVRLLQILLFGVSSRDPIVYAAVLLGVALVGLLANFVPARRAAAVDPIRALRFE